MFSLSFIILQIKEFLYSYYSLSYSNIGSIFYFTVGLHGLHVLIGSLLFIIIFFIILLFLGLWFLFLCYYFCFYIRLRRFWHFIFFIIFFKDSLLSAAPYLIRDFLYLLLKIYYVYFFYLLFFYIMIFFVDGFIIHSLITEYGCIYFSLILNQR